LPAKDQGGIRYEAGLFGMLADTVNQHIPQVFGNVGQIIQGIDIARCTLLHITADLLDDALGGGQVACAHNDQAAIRVGDAAVHLAVGADMINACIGA
jgi:hypothetical protein